MTFFTITIDTFLIARFFGAGTLGLYNRAKRIVNIPMESLTASIIKVIFPVFSKIQNDRPKLKKAYLDTITILSAILFPICFGIYAASEQIVLVVLGSKWIEAIPILSILTFSGPLAMISMIGSTIGDATAKLNVRILFNFIFIIVLTVSFFGFRNHGITVFAFIIVIGEIFRNLFYVIFTKKVLNLSYRNIIKAYMPGILLGIISLVGIHVVTIFIGAYSISLIITFLIQILVGVISVFVFGFLFPFGNLKIILMHQIGKMKFVNDKFGAYLVHLKWYRDSMK